ncbi:MAG TPA: PAS domain S-box protein [Candidatus Acidoferrum sp.]|nr:PAS domain S-box protein [Candidatus Acidoferrum sp.]
MTASALGPDPRNLILQRQPGSFSQGDHVAYFYQESDSLLEAVSTFIGSALGAGNAAVVIASKVHREGLGNRLTARGLDVPKTRNEGRYIELDASELLSKIMVEGMPDSGRFEAIVGGAIARSKACAKAMRPEVAAFGEMVSLLWTEGKVEAAIRLEQLWNELAKNLTFSLRCAYPVSHFNGEKNSQPLMRVCAEHSAIVLDEGDTSFASGEAKIALRRSEERFRLLVDAVQDYAIFMLDVQGHVSSWNKGAERIKGYSVPEIIGKHFSIFYPEEDIRAGKPPRELEIAAKEGRLEDEGWRLRKDGSRFWANVTITAIRNDAGRLIGFGKVTRDFTERIKANEALRKEIIEKTAAERKVLVSEKALRQLSLRLLQTQDEERRRIGRDLHDSVGQYLVGLKMKVDSLKSSRERGQPEDDSQLTECSQLIEEAIKEVRTISYLLHPPMLEELGLKSAIPWYLEGFTKRSGIKTTFEVSPEFDRIPDDLELALFRVLQESLTNVHRHSGSPRATVRLLTENHRVLLQIIDEGSGTQTKNGEDRAQEWMGTLGVGLRGMTERVRQLGGSLELSSAQGGTTVTASIPIPEVELGLSKDK